jgi:translation initiation factor IF-1
MSGEALEVVGVVTGTFRGDLHSVDVELGGVRRKVLATRSGRLNQNRIRIIEGDVVTVEVSPYDLGRGGSSTGACGARRERTTRHPQCKGSRRGRVRNSSLAPGWDAARRGDPQRREASARQRDRDGRVLRGRRVARLSRADDRVSRAAGGGMARARALPCLRLAGEADATVGGRKGLYHRRRPFRAFLTRSPIVSEHVGHTA